MKNSSVLHRAGQESLSKSGYKLIQDLSNEHQYKQIPNQITTYIDSNGKQVTAQQLQQLINQSDKSQVQSQIKPSRRKNSSNKKQQIENADIQKIYHQQTKELDNQTQLKSSNYSNYNYYKTHKNKTKGTLNFHNDLQLSAIQSIIQQIGSFMKVQEIGRSIGPSKNNLSKQNSKINKKWGQNISKFQQPDRLDRMLQNYKSDGQHGSSLVFQEQILQEQKAREKRNIFHKQNIKQQQQYIQQTQFRQSLQKSTNLPFMNIFAIHWSLLPVVPSHFHQLYLNLSSFPHNASYQSIILKVIEKQVQHYSIFYQNKQDQIVGTKLINHKLSLMSELQYATKWEDTFDGKGIISQQEQQTLMQFDLQWYRTLLYFAYKSGLEEILQQPYNIEKYLAIAQQIRPKQTVNQQTLQKFKNSYIKGYTQRQIKKEKSMPSSTILIVQGVEQSFINPVYIDSFYIQSTKISLNIIEESNISMQFQNNSLEFSNKLLIIFDDKEHSEQGNFETILNVTIKQEDSTLLITMKKQSSDKKKPIHQINIVDQMQFGKLYAIKDIQTLQQ